MSSRHKEFAEQLLSVRPVTRSLVTSILMDAWPSHAAIVDFGIDSQKHYEALYYPIREAEIMPKALDAALGDGPKLTAMTREAASNPHKDVQFQTSWDVVLGRGSAGAPANGDFKEMLHGSSRRPAQEAGKEQAGTQEILSAFIGSGLSPHDVADFWRCQGLTPPWVEDKERRQQTERKDHGKSEHEVRERSRDRGIER
jgi:hypothetical protein